MRVVAATTLFFYSFTAVDFSNPDALFPGGKETLLNINHPLPRLNFVDTVSSGSHVGCHYAFNPASSQSIDSIHYRYLDSGIYDLFSLQDPVSIQF